MEQVTHRVDKYGARLFPFEWSGKNVRMSCYLESVAVIRIPHGLETSGHALSIAVLTSGTDLGAPRNGIPGRFGPFD